jgi:hypothetical protein
MHREGVYTLLNVFGVIIEVSSSFELLWMVLRVPGIPQMR